ncbi:hypothetical protein M9458_031522, partial [Cirrhinus mrigala]
MGLDSSCTVSAVVDVMAVILCPSDSCVFLLHAGAFESFAMATKIVTERCQEEQMGQMSHGMQ